MSIVVCITQDEQLAVGHNNAAGLARLTTFSDSNSITFRDVKSFPGIEYGERIPVLSVKMHYNGLPTTRWISDFMTVQQYKYIRDNWHNQEMTIRTLADDETYANYNATLLMQDPGELEAGKPPHYRNVEWTWRGLEAI